MFAHLPRQGPSPQPAHPRTVTPKAGTRLRRLVAVLAGVTAALLASVATIPAAFASVEPDPARTSRVVTGGGMPGWQTALIALGAVLLVAAAAVLLDRALATRRPAPAPAAPAPASPAPASPAPAA
jgi:5'-nucleotidase / UDP-sugar diphosphatase